jgi:hypothetical protein
MRTFSRKQDHSRKSTSSTIAPSRKVTAGGPVHLDPVSQLQRTTDKQAGQPVVQSHGDERDAGPVATASPHLAHDFSSIPVHSPTVHPIQTKLVVNTPGDKYEREADRVADEVMQMASGERPVSLTMTPMPYQGRGDTGWDALPMMHDLLRSPGRPLDPYARRFMEARFRHDFSGVRIHDGRDAHRASKAIKARSFTIRSNIAFAHGMYHPHTVEGKKLLAHELTHTIQQRPPSVQGVIQRQETSKDRAPISSVNAGERWRQVIKETRLDSDYLNHATINATKDLLLATESGCWLLERLEALFCNGSGQCASRIEVIFADEMPPDYSKASGFFRPSEARARRYEVHVKTVKDSAPRGLFTIAAGGETQRQKNAVEAMATTLFHELLHVWFVNEGSIQDIPWDQRTGHGNLLDGGKYHPDFKRRLDDFEEDLRSQPKNSEAARTDIASGPVPEPPSGHRISEDRIGEREESTKQSGWLGGELSAHGGISSREQPTGVFGADLILEELAALRVGARGIYLPPDRLFAGATVGMRFVDDETGPGSRGPATNPLYFDLEAGVLMRLSRGESDRLVESLAGYASTGLGQEFGRRGGRLFWRIGGYVIVTERNDLIWGGTLGGGVRL